MSLAKKMQSLEGKGRFVIWKRTSSPTSVQTIRKNITKYLSENTKEGVDVAAAVAQNHPNWLKEGVDYLTKEDQGRLKVYGFLRDDITRLCGKFPHRMDNNDLVDACFDAWNARLKKKNIKRVAHKYVLSLDPQLCEVLMQTKHSADELLTNSVRQVMRRYQEKYYPDEKIGYLVGIHHDKAHLHAHVMLFPTTERGKLLRITDESSQQGGRKPFQFMRSTAEKEIERFYNKEIKYPYKATQKDNQRYTQPRILAFVSMSKAEQAVKEQKLSLETRGAWMFQERERLLHGPQDALQGALKEGYKRAEQVYSSLLYYQNKDTKSLERFEKNLNSKMNNAKNELDSCYKELAAIKKEFSETSRTRRSLFEDVSYWAHFRFNHAHISQGGYNMRDHKVADWAASKLGKSDALGHLMHEWIAEKRSRKEAVDLPRQMIQLMASAENPVSAQKFTEKDRFARKCIGYANPKIRNQTYSMLDHFYRQEAVLSVRSQKDFVKEFLKAEIRKRSAEIEEMNNQRTEISKRTRELRIQLQAFQLERDIAQGVKQKRRPGFLEEFKHWESFNLPIPTRSLDVMRNPSQSVAVEKVGDTSFSSRVSKALSNLRRKREATADEPTVKNQFRVSKTASAPDERMQRGRMRISDNEVDSSNTQKFLGLRRDGLPRVEVANASSAEERRLHVRERYMGQDEDGALAR